MKYQNIAVAVSNYATEELNKILKDYGKKGFKLVNTVMAKNNHGVEVMYLFFVKECENNAKKE